MTSSTNYTNTYLTFSNSINADLSVPVAQSRDLQTPLLPQRDPRFRLPDSTLSSLSFLSRIGTTTRRIALLTNQLGMLSLNAVYFTGKVLAKVSDKVMNGAFLAMNCFGFVSLPYNLHYTYKSIKDIGFAGTDNILALCMAASKLSELVNNLLLFGTAFTAAMYGVKEDYDAQTKIYLQTKYWSFAIIGLGTFNSIVLIGVNRWILRKIKVTAWQPVQYSNIFKALIDKGEGLRTNPERHFCAYLRVCMDKDTLDHLLSKLRQISNIEREANNVLISYLSVDLKLECSQIDQIMNNIQNVLTEIVDDQVKFIRILKFITPRLEGYDPIWLSKEENYNEALLSFFEKNVDIHEELFESVTVLIEIRSRLVQFLNVIKQNLQTQADIEDRGQLLLNLFGDALLIYEKYVLVNSVQAAYIGFCTSLAYTLKSMIDLYREVKQRKKISEIASGDLIKTGVAVSRTTSLRPELQQSHRKMGVF